ncbi:hypothetical protein [Cellulosimicrobium arenosum]|uniref:Uncharacterized protein n=1 Tax=Cellulosimicrobium arenosum TaxID=2708133 RepID=A0A927J0P7_9MICO|nr:hypothetical protein [Cellulosimicrobium arenosum]MBD8079677.1 hypothetical protein [Cellulosimicrobium arenosum]
MSEHEEKPRGRARRVAHETTLDPVRRPGRARHEAAGVLTSTDPVQRTLDASAVRGLQTGAGNSSVAQSLSPEAAVQRSVTTEELFAADQEVFDAVLETFPKHLTAVIGEPVSFVDVLDHAQDAPTLIGQVRFFLKYQEECRAAAKKLLAEGGNVVAERAAIEDRLIDAFGRWGRLPSDVVPRLASALSGRVALHSPDGLARARYAEWLAIPGVQVTKEKKLLVAMQSSQVVAFANRHIQPRKLNLRFGSVGMHDSMHEALHILSGAGWDKHVGLGDAQGWPATVEGATELMTRLLLQDLGIAKGGDYYLKEVNEALRLMKLAGIDVVQLVGYYFQDASVFRGVLRIKEDVQGGGGFISSAVLDYTGGSRKKKVGAHPKEATQ